MHLSRSAHVWTTAKRWLGGRAVLKVPTGIAAAILCTTAAWAQGGVADAPADDPKFMPQELVLEKLPKPVGRRIVLFNGRDLSGWDAWLGYRDPANTYKPRTEEPLGTEGTREAFRVVREDGRPAIYIPGKIWGALVHKSDFGNYHLRLEYKWGPGRWAPREKDLPNNGLLYHSHGEMGAVFGTWMKSVEFEIMQGSTGMMLGVSPNIYVRTTVGRDLSIAAPHRRFQLGGRNVEIGPWRGAVENNRDAELPAGNWNRLDLYVVGDKAVHVVNGVPVMEVHGIRTVDAEGKSMPLTHGRIQFQSEGAETYFRNIVLEPIDRLPVVRVK